MAIVGIIIFTILYAGYVAGGGREGDRQGGVIGSWIFFLVAVGLSLLGIAVAKICCTSGLALLLLYPLPVYYTWKERHCGKKGIIFFICLYVVLFLCQLTATTECSGVISSTDYRSRAFGLEACECCQISTAFAGFISLIVISYEIYRLCVIRKNDISNPDNGKPKEDHPVIDCDYNYDEEELRMIKECNDLADENEEASNK